jgi:hypothetical protein
VFQHWQHDIAETQPSVEPMHHSRQPASHQLAPF